jgi:hypothetical protein
MPVTDYHGACRDAVRSAIATALADYTDLATRVVTADDIGNYDVTRLVAMPCVVCACIAPEVDRSELSTNAQDGIGYSVVVAMFAAGVANGETSPNIPDPTLFRRIVRNTFGNKRLSAVAQVAWCDVGEAGGALWDKKSPAWQRLSAAMVVTCNGRWPRS